MSRCADQVIERLRASLQREERDQFGSHIDLLGKTVKAKLWAHRTDESGSKFACFPDFVLHPPPQGLGVRTEQTVELLRHGLKSLGYVEEWVELLDRIVTEPGRPTKNPTNGANFRFYALPRSPQGQDRTLLKLKRERPDLLHDVAGGKMSAHKAAIQAGWRRGRVEEAMSQRRLEELSIGQRIALLLRLFESLGPDARQLVMSELAAQPP